MNLLEINDLNFGFNFNEKCLDFLNGAHLHIEYQQVAEESECSVGP